MWWPTNIPAPENVTFPGFAFANFKRSATELNGLSGPTINTAGSAPQFAIGSKLSMLYLVSSKTIDWEIKCGTL